MYTELERLDSDDKLLYYYLHKKLSDFEYSFMIKNSATKDITRIFNLVLRDDPRIFWLLGAAEYRFRKDDPPQRDNLFTAKPVSGITPETVRSMSKELYEEVRRIASEAKKQKSDFDSVLYIHDHIINTTNYSTEDDLCYTPYGCLINHRACCAGYSKAFQMIANELGFECGIVTGKSIYGEQTHSKHIWNYIRLEDELYYLDVTWDDPTVNYKGEKTECPINHYFLVDNDELLRTHTPDKDYFVPDCRGRKYNYHRYKGYFFELYDFKEIKESAEKQLRNGNSFTVKFAHPAYHTIAVCDLRNFGRINEIQGVNEKHLFVTAKHHLAITVIN